MRIYVNSAFTEFPPQHTQTHFSIHYTTTDPISAVPEKQCSHFISKQSGPDLGTVLAEQASAAVHYKDYTDKHYAIELDIGVLYKSTVAVTYNCET